MKRVPGFPDYEVSEDGVVISHRGCGRYRKPYAEPRLLSPILMPNGYLVVYLRDSNGKRHTCYIHRLVAITYLGKSYLPEVNHKDSNKLNNSHLNLEWVTSLENMRHLTESGNHPQALEVVLTNGSNSVVGKSAAHAARLAGISKSSLNNLKSGKRLSVNGWRLV